MRRNIIDRTRVREMAEMGLTRKEIGRRLGCSERHVRRILSECKMNNVECKMSKGAVRADEHQCWRVAFAVFGSYSAVAQRFGVSRQAVYGIINNYQLSIDN